MPFLVTRTGAGGVASFTTETLEEARRDACYPEFVLAAIKPSVFYCNKHFGGGWHYYSALTPKTGLRMERITRLYGAKVESTITEVAKPP